MYVCLYTQTHWNTAACSALVKCKMITLESSDSHRVPNLFRGDHCRKKSEREFPQVATMYTSKNKPPNIGPHCTHLSPQSQYNNYYSQPQPENECSWYDNQTTPGNE